MLCVGLTVMAGGPSRASYPKNGIRYVIYERSNLGSAVNPITHTTCVPQDGIFEIVQYDDSSGFIINGVTSIYIKNIVYGADKELGDYWVKASKVYGTGNNPDRILVPLPQTLLKMDSDGNLTPVTINRGRKAVLTWGSVSYNAAAQQSSFSAQFNVNQVTYTADGSNIHIENTDGPVAIDTQEDVSYDATGIGIVWEDEEEAGEDEDDYEWAGYCEWGTTLDASPYVITEQPEGELKTYNRTSISATRYTGAKASVTNEQLSCESQIVFGLDGKTIYFKDPIQTMGYDTWVMGTLNEDGTIITVPMQQYLKDYGDIGTVMIEFGYSSGSTTYSSFNSTDLYAEYEVQGNTISLKDTWTNPTETSSEYSCVGLHCYDPETKKEVSESEIVYVLKEDTPEPPTVQTGVPVFNGYTDDGIHAYIVEILPSEPSTIYYRVQYPDGEFTEWAVYTEPLSFTGDGKYRVEAYAVAANKLPSEQISYEFVVSPITGLSEMAIDKQIANKRFYNVMGEQIDQPENITIVVTTYTDGTTTAVKVVK